MAKYRPDRPVGLDKRLTRKDEGYVDDLEKIVEYFGDENVKLIDARNRDHDSRLVLQRELDLHRKYLAVMSAMRGVSNR